MNPTLQEYIESGLHARRSVDLEKIHSIAVTINERIGKGGKVITFGNGGSAADAQHFAGELDGHFTVERKALPAIAITTNTSSLTAIANDYSYDEVFSRPVAALAGPNDIVFGISTSGNSRNVIRGLEEARRNGSLTVAMAGKSGGKMAGIADILLNVDSDFTPVIQEVHISMIHMICLELDRILLDNQRMHK